MTRTGGIWRSWQRSTFSGTTGEGCLEVARHGESLLFRESDAPFAAVLRTSAARLAALMDAVRAGHFDVVVVAPALNEAGWTPLSGTSPTRRT
ncbi:DUF397 domain-containing protein [Streptomyces sp. 4N509B]|uniref:DUF397 domain-containing protein n=1 Tax=Streptomyces sp. 4N509B TaxID=3457413 RepID=UPI003FD4CC11